MYGPVMPTSGSAGPKWTSMLTTRPSSRVNGVSIISLLPIQIPGWMRRCVYVPHPDHAPSLLIPPSHDDQWVNCNARRPVGARQQADGVGHGVALQIRIFPHLAQRQYSPVRATPVTCAGTSRRSCACSAWQCWQYSRVVFTAARTSSAKATVSALMVPPVAEPTAPPVATSHAAQSAPAHHKPG